MVELVFHWLQLHEGVSYSLVTCGKCRGSPRLFLETSRSRARTEDGLPTKMVVAAHN